ncbi:mechanosensitive ion channel family protein [Marinilongibacter aquaticus]|uniref:mechanosensitive ion channel family protein n=1 Tax=Marinilongibacter aquaticus TaxID=2975157 RepID=UPI0021BD6FB4|nr:mechanosensitive ion channel family protein [Marinilongibacter aquaticus]UBM58372.1 mechanosensitive ion channel family protein [Marinilongibacter aquaticus]
MTEHQLAIDILLWIVALPAGWILGRLFKALVFPIFRKHAERTENNIDDTFVSSAEKIVVPIFWIIGVWLAFHYSDLFFEYKSDIKKAIVVFTIVCITWASSYLINEIARVYLLRLGKNLPNTSIFSNLVSGGVFVVGLLFILRYLKIDIAPALAALGVGGLAVALALQDTLSNLFAGLQMLAAKKLKPGDYVKLENGDEGFVEDIAWRNTTVRALGNHIIIVPNSKLASSIVKNFILPDSQNSVLVGVGVSYDSDLALVERITIEVAKEIQGRVDGAVRDHEPFIRYNSFADSSINFNVILRSSDFTSQYLITHEFIKALHVRYNKENIEIPFPIRTVHLKKEE